MSNGSNQHLSCSSFKNYSSGILSLPHPSIHTDKLKIIDNDQSPAKCSGSPLYLGVIPIMKSVFITQSCLILCHPMDCSPSGSSVHGILQARILEWVAIPFSRGSSWFRDRTQGSHSAGSFFNIWTTKEALFPSGPPHLSFISWYIKQSIPPAKDANIPGVESSSDI